MRTREEIEEELDRLTEKSNSIEGLITHQLIAQTELLLDIRDLLSTSQK